MKTKNQNKNSAFEKFASAVCKATGSTPAFIIAFLIVVVWAVSGPFFDYSETWQLVINTGTTIITFLMVFLIQKAQNKDSLAIQLKLNELVASNEYSSNSLVDIESMTEEEMEIIQKYYRRLSELAKKDETIRTSHSIAEAHEQHERKDKNRNQNKAKIKPAKKPNTPTATKTSKTSKK
ncbi:low affinity iron permease family protein [Flavobacterium sp. LC2016-01]|uniref:low affinity iron permease family protein n=1 Tax=Flavobacterium sp. LC2016-01 TaxID=2675876 RepID=UPI0012BADB9A|nr:low affinity iron permease family protein [Flavobacterium sp. LC2016-01]MTH15954.1 low affinity iron permease family protein [Flavobacterium sp. LC2016-01]